MLILSRRIGERILIEADGETIAVEIMRIGGTRVAVGVLASQSVVVRREELTPLARLNDAPASPVSMSAMNARRSVIAEKRLPVR